MVCFHFLCSVLQDDYKLQHSAYFWRNKSCISIWFRSNVCLTYETHLADVIYHRALFSCFRENSCTGGSLCDRHSHLCSGGMTVASERESELWKIWNIGIFQFEESFCLLVKAWQCCQTFSSFFFLIFLGKDEQSITGYENHFPRLVGVSPDKTCSCNSRTRPFGKLQIARVSVATLLG